MGKKRKLTIYDIAKISGYSPKTVSRVANGGKNVKKTTYDSVKKILDEYNYVPNTFARNLISKTNKNILISVQKTESYPLKWFNILLEKIIIECRRHDMNVIVEYLEKNDSIESSVLTSSSTFIGAAVLFYETKDDKRVSYLNKIGIPFIVFGKSDTEGVTYVSNNDYESLYTLMKHLVSRGLKKTLLLIADKTLVNMDRVKGAKDAHRELGLKDDLIQVVYQMKTIDDVYKFSKNYFSKGNNPEAVFVSGDEKVIGLTRALNELNIKVPEDISVIGFDNIPIAEYYSPALSTIAQDYIALSEEIVARLQELVSGKYEIDSIEIPTKLIIRETIK